MYKGKRIKPEVALEYRLLLTHRYNERRKKTVMVAALRTTNEFSNFRYQIVVEEHRTNNELRLKIQGLRAPQVSLPGSGPATFEKEYDDFAGQLTLIVTKLGGEENIFEVGIHETIAG
jgi:hypothetical protein